MDSTSSSSFVITENFEMLKALYDFQAVYPKTISFDEGEYFILHQTSARQRNWWQVVSMKGAIGFVPSNYVMKLQVDPNFLIGFLDSSIESLKSCDEDEINGIIARLELIDRLEEKKLQIELSVKATSTDGDDIFATHTKGGVQSSGSSSSIDVHDPSSSSSLSMQKESKNNTSDKTPPIIPPQESPSMDSLMKQSLTTTNSGDEAPTVVSKSDNNEDLEKSGASICSQSLAENNCIIKKGAAANQMNGSSLITITDSDPPKPPRKSSERISINESDVYQMVDSIRHTTNLSHHLSIVAVKVVLSELESICPSGILRYIEPVAQHLTKPFDVDEHLCAQTHDAQRLRIIFTQLADCKNDSEQRTWMLYEDEDYIVEFLLEFIDIMKNADPRICQYELHCDEYGCVQNLVQYYQMETRWPIRKLLLDAFAALCVLESTLIDVLLTSVLPVELIHDLQTNCDSFEHLKEIGKMLTMIFASGQKLPINDQEHIRATFILYLLDMIENPPSIDVHESLPDVMIKLILAINLQFDDYTRNYILEAMHQAAATKVFTEKVLLLFNRGEDPLNIYEHSKLKMNSVLKMFIDLFSCKETSNIFYTNDTKVLMDIVVRQLSDLSAGDSVRRSYLELCRRIIRNTNYSEHTHRKQDLMKIFTRIFCEEDACSANDQQMVRDIANEFPQHFKA